MIGPAKVGSTVQTNPPMSSIESTMTEPKIKALLEQFWKLDTLEKNQKVMRTAFYGKYRKKANNRLSVGLPFKDDLQILGKSLPMAYQRVYALERRLERDSYL